MAILNHGSTIRTADGGQSATTIVTASNIGTYGVAANSTYYVGTTQNVFNRASGAQSLTGVSIDGNAANITAYTINQNVGSSNSPTFATLQLTRLNFGADNAQPWTVGAGGTAGTGLTFGGDYTSSQAYKIFTAMENVGGNYSKLTLNWHTGIRIGAYYGYGGTRFYNNLVGEGTEIFSVGNADSNVRVVNNIYAQSFYDITNTAYYLDPANTGTSLLVAGSVGVSKTSIRSGSILDVNGYGCFGASAYGFYIGTDATGAFLDAGSQLIRMFAGSSEKLRIQADGNVGIGTTSPGYKLDITGDARIASAAGAGALYFGTLDPSNVYLKVDNNYDLTLAQNASSGNGLYLAGAGNVYVSIDSNNNATADAFIVQNNAIKAGTELFRVQENGVVTASSDFRAPIFYDSNDTGYYVDPNSVSRLSSLRVYSAFDTASSDVYANMRVIRDLAFTDGMYIGYGNAGSGLTRIFGGGATTGELVKHSDHTVESNSFRAPIFYDNNNTAYYIDPASTSAVNRIDILSGSAAINTTTPGTSVYQLNFTGQSTADYAQAITWGWSTSGAEAGIYVQSSGGYGTKMYIATTDSFVTGSKTAITIDHTGIVTINRNYLQATGSLRSSIFYDNDNTAYYTDPTGTSNLVGLTVANTITGSVSGNAGTATILQTARNINGTSFNGSAAITTASWGTARTLTIGSTGKSVDGSAAVAWSLAEIGAAAIAQTMFIGTTSVAINRGSASQTLTGVSIDGNAATATNGLTTSNYVSYSAFTGAISSGGAITATSYIYTSTYLQTGGNLIYPSGYGATQKLEVGNSANNTWIDGITIAPGGIVTAPYNMRSPIYYDSDNTAYYLDPANSGTSLLVAGNVGIGTTSPGYKLHVIGGQYGTLLKGGDLGTGSDVLRMLKADDAVAMLVRGDGLVGIGTTDFSYTINDNSRVVGSNTNNRLFVSGSIQLLGNNDAIVFGRGTSTFLTDEELGFGWGGGWYMTDETYLRVRNNKVLYTTGEIWGSIFKDSNDTAYYLNPASTSNLNALTVAGGNATIYRDLIVNGGGSGNFGNRIIVQGTATTYTYQDTTLRPTVYLNGAYPVVTLNATESTNTLHGPTLQFAFNGLTTGGATSRQIVIGTPGTGSWLDFGFSGGANGDNSTYNPHNGIGGYNGVTAMRLFSNGLLLGSTGAYPSAITSTSFALDVRGTGSSNTDFRAPIFYDSNNTAYYIDGASGSKLKYLQIDGDWGSSPFGSGHESFTIRSTYASMVQRQTNGGLGYWLHHIASDAAYYLYGGKGATDGSSWDWSYKAYPNQDGSYVEFRTSARAPLFYDSNDTAYYVDPNGTSSLYNLSLVGAKNTYLIINPGNGSEAMVRYIGGSGSGWYVGKRMSSQLVGTADFHFFSEAAGATVGGVDTSGNIFSSGSVRSPIFYDSNNTAYYVDPSSTGYSAYFAGAIQATKIGIEDGGLDCYMEITDANPTVYGVGYGGEFIFYGDKSTPASFLYYGGATVTYTLQANSSLRSPIFYDSDNTAYYVDPASTSVMNQINLAGILRRTASAAGYLEGNYPTGVDSNSSSAIYTIGGAYQPAATNLGNMYGCGYTVGNGTANPGLGASGWGFYVASGGTSRIFLDSDSGYGIASNSWRAPIFYDSNDTAFYGDFASTSVLNRLNYQQLRRNFASTVYTGTAGSRTVKTFSGVLVGGSAIGGNSAYTVIETTIPQGAYQMGGFTINWFENYSSTNAKTTIEIAGYWNPVSNGGFQGFEYTTSNPNVQPTIRVGANASGNTVFILDHFSSSYTVIIARDLWLGYDTTDGEWGTGWTMVNTTTIAAYSNIVSAVLRVGPTLTGTGASGTWSINVTGNAGGSSASCTGNSATTTLATKATRANGDFYIDDNFGNTIVGLYSPTKYQGVFTMGNSYKLAVDGSGTGNLYGIAWSHPNAGGVAANLSDHGALIIQNGAFSAAISSSIRCTVDMRTPIYYDSNNTAYYCDPNGVSNLYGVAIRGDVSATSTDNQIFFWGTGSGTTSAIGFKANGGSFANPTGNGDGYNTYLTMDTDGRGWVFRRGVGGTDFTSAYTAGWILNNGIWQANASMRAPIFYDSNNTAYYLDPASTSILNRINLNTVATAYMQWRTAGQGTISGGFPFYNNVSYGSINIEVSDNDTGGLVIDNEGVTVYGAGDNGEVFRVIDEDVYQATSNLIASRTFWVNQLQNGGGGILGPFSISGTATASSFTGAGTGLTGTAASLTIGGNAANVTGTVAIANGGTGATSTANARTNLGATTVGSNLFTLSNPSAITFLRVNADNTVSALNASDFRTAIGAGGGGVTIETSLTQSLSGTTGCTIDVAAANVHILSLANTTNISGFTYNNRSSGPSVNTLMIVIKYAGNVSITWTNVVWSNGITPTLTQIPDRADVFMLTSYKGGAATPVWIGTVVAAGLVSTNL